jgi:hypothetical protein
MSNILDRIALNVSGSSSKLTYDYDEWRQLQGLRHSTHVAIGFAFMWTGMGGLCSHVNASSWCFHPGYYFDIFSEPSNPNLHYWGRARLEQIGQSLSIEGADCLGLLVMEAIDGSEHHALIDLGRKKLAETMKIQEFLTETRSKAKQQFLYRSWASIRPQFSKELAEVRKLTEEQRIKHEEEAAKFRIAIENQARLARELRAIEKEAEEKIQHQDVGTW